MLVSLARVQNPNGFRTTRFADGKGDREAFARLAADYLTEHGDIPDSRVRFDGIKIVGARNFFLGKARD